MRIITVTYPVYQFAELSAAAKEKVRSWYSETQDPAIFTMQCNEDLYYLFPESNLHVEYSLGYCQGDGLNIYGKLYLDELLENMKENFTDEEMEYFSWIFDNFGSSYELPRNGRYCYCICDDHDYMNDFIEEMEYSEMEDIRYHTMEKFNKYAREYLTDLCKRYEKDGYEFFYEFDDSTLEEACTANEWEFTENGEIA